MSVATILSDGVVSSQYLPIAYGSFSYNTNPAVSLTLTAGVPLPVPYNTADIVPYGVSCSLPSASIIVRNRGTYKVLTSLQIDKTTGGTGEIDSWIAVNGTAVPNSATKLEINQNIESLMTVEWFLDLNANDAVSVVVYAPGAGLQLKVVIPTPPVPAIPAIITTIVLLRRG